MGFLPNRGAGGSVPRAKAIASGVTPAAGAVYTMSRFGLLAPVVYAKTGGNANLTVAAGTGIVSAAAAWAAGEAQIITGTATGADGVVLPWSVALTGQQLPTIAFANPTVSITEGNSGTTTVTNTINLTRNGVAGALVVNLTYGGTAAGGVDYATAPVSVTIPSGQNSASFDILINGDTAVEPNETIVINAVEPVSGASASKTITITDEDAGAPSMNFTIPVQDWRAVANGVTDLSGTAIPALAAQQASAATKTRGAGVNAPASGTTVGAIFDLPAHTEDYVATYHGHNGFNTLQIIDFSTDSGATWTDSGYTLQTSTGTVGGSPGRRQAIRIPAGPAKLVRFRWATTVQATMTPLMFKLPSTGKAPIIALFGNSLIYYPFDVPNPEGVIMANNPGFDPLILNWGQPSAGGVNLSVSPDAFATAYPNLARYAISQGINGTTVSSTRPYTGSQQSGLAGYINTLYNKIEALGLEHIALADTYRPYNVPGNTGYDAAKVCLPDNQMVGVLSYNIGSNDPLIQSRYPSLWDATYLAPSADIYKRWLTMFTAGGIGDGIHPNDDALGLGAARTWHATTTFPMFFTNTTPKPEIVRIIEKVEASALQKDYDDVAYALVSVPDAAPGKASIQSRLTATIPAVKYKSAQVAITAADVATALAESSGLQSSKDLAQTAINSAQSAINTAISSGSTGTTALQNMLNAIQDRLTAVVVITVTKRAKVNLGAAVIAPDYGAALSANGTVSEIRDTGGAKFTVTTSNGSPTATITAVQSGTVTEGVINVASGIAPGTTFTFGTFNGTSGTIILSANATTGTTRAASTPGAVTGWTLTATNISSASAANGISGGTDPGTAPNDFQAGQLFSYVSGATSITLALVGLDSARQYNIYLAAGRNGTTEASEGASAVGSSTVAGDPASVQPTASYKQIVMRGVRPTGGGGITVNVTRVAPNASFVYANALIVEEATV